MREKIFVCSPLSPIAHFTFEVNQDLARLYCRWVFNQGYRPFAPHLFYTQFLNEFNPQEREDGINAGVEDLCECKEVWAFLPLGFALSQSKGMCKEIRKALELGIPVRLFAVSPNKHRTDAAVREIDFVKEMLDA